MEETSELTFSFDAPLVRLDSRMAGWYFGISER
jgi:hypothetical protein